MCSIFKHLVKHLVNKGHSIPVLVYLQDFYNNTRYCYELKCGPGQRGLSGHSQRFPSLGCEAYPRDLLVDCVWFKRAFTFVSEKRSVTSQLPPLVVTLWLSFSFFQDFVSFIMWCIQLTTFIVRYQSCMCVFPFTFCPQHHDFVCNDSLLFNSCMSQLASLFSSQHGISEPHVVVRAVLQHCQRMLLVGLSSFFGCDVYFRPRFSLKPRWRDVI